MLVLEISLYFIFSVLSCAAKGLILADSRSLNARDIHLQLFHGDYLRAVLPFSDTGGPKVRMKFSLFSLDEVNEKDQKMVTSGRLVLSWYDNRLSWGTQHFGNVTSIFAHQGTLWVPDIIVANSVISQKQLGFDELPCRVMADGLVDWRPAILLETSCNMDVTYFPFDTQECDIVFETLITTTDEVNILLNLDRNINLRGYSENGQWKLVATFAYNYKTDTSQNGVVFSLLLERRKTFYILAIFMPVFFLSLTGTLAFALPPESGEKMSVSLTVLLAYAVHLTVVFDQLPNTSVQISVFALYLTTEMSITCFSVIMTALILRLYHKPKTEPVGPKTRKLVKVLGKISCMRVPASGWSASNVVAPSPQERGCDETYRSKMSGKTDAKGKLQSLDDPMFTALPKPDCTWQDVSKVLDRSLFLLSTLFSIVTTLTCLFELLIGSKVDRDSFNFGSMEGSSSQFWQNATRY